MEDKAKLKQRLVAYIKEHSYLKSEKPIFLLSSGEMSNFYFDLRRTTLSPEGQHLIGNLFMEKIGELGLKPKAIGGLTMGADPVATSVAYASFLRGQPIEAFVIRKEAKKHGLGLQIEGKVQKGDPIIIIDDVLTTGKSTIKAMEIASASGLDIIAVIVLLDRMEKDGKENVGKLGKPVYSILNARDFD